MPVLWLLPEQFSREAAPCDQFAVASEGCEESVDAVLPDQILILGAHSDEGKRVPVRDRQDHEILETANERQIVRSPAPIDEAIVASGCVAHPDFLELAAEKCKEIYGGEAGFLHEVFILVVLQQLVFVLIIRVGLKDLVTELLHDVQVLRVDHPGLNNLQAINASRFDSFVVEDVDVVVRHNDKAVLLNIRLDHLFTHKRKQHYVFVLALVVKNIFDFLFVEQVNGESVKEGVVAPPRLSILSHNYRWVELGCCHLVLQQRRREI